MDARDVGLKMKVYLLIHNPGYEATPVLGAFSTPALRAEARQALITNCRVITYSDEMTCAIPPYRDNDLEDEDIELDTY